MLIDDALPDFDTTLVEHIVIDAPCDIVYRTTREMDFLQISSPAVDTVMFVRDLPSRVFGRLGRRPRPPAPPAMRLADMLDGSGDAGGLEGWLALGEVPGRELAFAAIGKVWQPDIAWRPVTSEEFPQFAEPDYAKIAAEFSIRPYGPDRALLSYEARTAGTDAAASRKFMRYWWLVRPFVRIVMQAALLTVKDLAESDSPVAGNDTVVDLTRSTGSVGERNLHHAEDGHEGADNDGH